MKLGHGLAANGLPAQSHDLLVTRYSHGLTDELGDRLLIVDAPTGRWLELLRFRQMLTAIPGFEVALRRRVELLSQFRHPSFAKVLGVEHDADSHHLILVSERVAGRRLSELLESARAPIFAASLLQHVTPALAALHEHGSGVGHGALTAARIVITPEGRPVIVEHALGASLARLQLTATWLYSDLGIAVPPTAPSVIPTFDSRTDLFQLALIVLSLLLGRRLRWDEYPLDVAGALDKVVPGSDRHPAAPLPALRTWLEPALQLNGKVFESSAEAVDALAALTDQVDGAGQPWQELVGSHPTQDDVLALTSGSYGLTPSAADERRDPSARREVESLRAWTESMPVEVAAPQESSSGDSFKHGASPDSDRSVVVTSERTPASPQRTPPPRSHFWRAGLLSRRHAYVWALVVVLVLVAAAEAVVIAMLLQRRRAEAPAPVPEVKVETPDPGAQVLVDGRSAGVTPLQLKIGADTRSLSVMLPAARRVETTTDSPVGSTGEENAARKNERSVAAASSARAQIPIKTTPVAQRTGGIRLVSPIDVEIFEGDKRLGSTATGIVSAPAGRHQLDVINSALGFRSRQVVDVKDGQVVALTVTPPNGRININAAPWAEVWIGGKPVGETPIGNLELPLGEHEIIFRHPQFGEQRQTALVRADGVTRVSANMQRQP